MTSELKPLVVGDLVVEKPVIQGGMGVGVSLHRLVGAVAKAGGMDIISATQVGFREPDFTTNFVETNLRSIRREVKLTREIAPQGAIGFNIMVATKHCNMWVKEAVKAGADIIILGAGLPVPLPEYMEAAYAEVEKKPDRRIKLAPIVSSVKSAIVICKMWDRKCHIAPDLVVAEGSLAGGHLEFSLDQLSAYGADTSDVPATYDREAHDREVKAVMKVVEEYGTKYGRHIPVIAAGDIYTHEDMTHQLELGADDVQVATRFVTTQECDASDAYKQAYTSAGKEDIVITQSPVDMPGRAILNPFLGQIKGGTRPAIKSCFQYLEHCDIRTTPYCITMASVYAVEGDTDHGLSFYESNVYRAEKIDTVDSVMKELTGELV